ncbi:unnamed protein product [Mytilus coruscus]|uniref:Peptidase A2 domain-containing protein n=1 Tax=Mytilus coruscus TaxID=42192 RepID=A0A6J8BG04_MYTCO|nr:unnamed protein product [Mytilus coruscus]
MLKLSARNQTNVARINIEKPVLSRVDAVNQYRDDINEKTIAFTSGILLEKHFEDNESSVDSVDGENSVCINRVESAVIQTSVKIHDYELKAVIDTGDEVTVLSEKVYRNLAKEHHLELKTAKRGLLVAEEGKKLSATGITEIEMSLGPLRFTWLVYVAPLNDDLLLGCDIIDEMDITVNTKRGIQIKDIWYPCEVKRRESNRLLKYHSGQRADAHQQGGSWRGEGNSYQRSGFGKIPNNQKPNVQHQDNSNDRARPKDKYHDDHMRASSPDRQDRSRPKDKNDKDHTRDPSPDRSLPEHCIQDTLGSSTDAAS